MLSINTNDSLTYEYKKIRISKELTTLWTENMSNFGWTLVNCKPVVTEEIKASKLIFLAPLTLMPYKKLDGLTDVYRKPAQEVDLLFKRRKEFADDKSLNRLQAFFVCYAKSIEDLEVEKESHATAKAYTAGLVAIVLTVLALICIATGNFPFAVAFGIAAISGYTLPSFMYKGLKKSKADELNPQINNHYNDIGTIMNQIEFVPTEPQIA